MNGFYCIDGNINVNNKKLSFSARCVYWLSQGEYYYLCHETYDLHYACPENGRKVCQWECKHLYQSSSWTLLIFLIFQIKQMHIILTTVKVVWKKMKISYKHFKNFLFFICKTTSVSYSSWKERIETRH